jgi:cytoskeletal protein CcmA (bactofilin family)
MSEKNNNEAERLNTIIGQGTVIKGECTVKGTVRVDGMIDGSLSASGVAIIGKTGEIKGDLVVQNSIVGGRVDGSVIAEGKIELQSGAKVEGDIKAKKLVVEEGVFFQGYCDMKEVVKEKGIEPALAKSQASTVVKDLTPKREKLEKVADKDDEQITFQGEPI